MLLDDVIELVGLTAITGGSMGGENLKYLWII